MGRRFSLASVYFRKNQAESLARTMASQTWGPSQDAAVSTACGGTDVSSFNGGDSNDGGRPDGPTGDVSDNRGGPYGRLGEYQVGRQNGGL